MIAAVLWGVLLWEVAVFAVAARLAWICGWRSGTGVRAEEALAAVLAIDLTLAATIAGVFSFAHANGAAAYLAIAVALLAAVVGIRPHGARRAAADLGTFISSAAVFERPLLFAVLTALFVPLLFLSLRPIVDVDSLYALHSLLDWMRNRSNPYTFRFQFPAFWELNYLPHLVIARSDAWLNLVSLKAVLLAGSALFVAARELGLPAMPAVFVTASFLSFRQLWWEHSGTATAKNDPARAAGVILLAIVLVRAAGRRVRRTDLVMLALGTAFVTVKSSGPLMAGFAILAVWILCRPGWRALAAIALLCLLTTGHYYVHNFLTFGNPVYPFQVTIAGHTLAGTGDPSFTSILHRAREARLWRLFLLPAGGVSPAGVLFPLVWIAAAAAAAWSAARGTWNWLRHRDAPCAGAWLGTFLLLGWAVYLASPFTAASGHTDLGYLENDLVSLRYATGELGISEVLLAAMLFAVAGPSPVVALAAVQMGSRLWLLYRHLALDVFSPVLVVSAAALTLVVLAALLGRTIRFKPGGADLRVCVTGRQGWVLAFLAVAVLPAVTPWIVERNRAHWADEWRPLYAPLREMPASGLFLAEDPRAGLVAGPYLLAGTRFQHDVRVAPEEAIGKWRPRFLARLISPGEPKPDFAAFASRWAQEGYEPVVAVEHGVLLERMVRMPAPQPLRAWLTFGGMPMRGLEVEAGHRLTEGDFVLSTATGHVYRIDASGTRRLEFHGGERLRLTNAGARGAGCDYVISEGVWAPESPPAPLNRDSDFRNAAGTRSLGGRFIAVSAGESRVEYLADAAGPFLRVHAQGPSHWLALVDHFPVLSAGAPVTIRARVRCPRAPGCKLSYVGPVSREVPAPANPEWQTLSLTLRRAASADDYAAVGLGEAQAGDSFDVREFALFEGFYPEITAAGLPSRAVSHPTRR